MSGSDCYHWEARRKERVLERARTAQSQQRQRTLSENAQRPNTAESGNNAVERKPEDGVQKREGKKISPAKLQRRLSDLDYDMQW